MNLRKYALLLLARREYPKWELKQKFIAKGYQSLEVETLLSSLVMESLQNDERYAETYVRQRIKTSFSPRRIVVELQQRGVARSLTDHHVPQDEQFWRESLSRLCQRKYRSLSLTKQASQSQARFLMQRGIRYRINLSLDSKVYRKKCRYT